MNDLNLAGNLVTSPSAAFAELHEKPRFLIPLILLCSATAALVCWYYLAVDFEWAKDQMMNANTRMQSMPEESRARMMSNMTLNRVLIPGTVVSAISIALVMALLALYYWVAGKITSVQLSYKHWFTLAVWSALPSLLGVIAGAVMLAMQGSNLQIPAEGLQVLSLNELFFHRTSDQPGFRLLASINLLSLWCWFLSIVGVHVWSRRSWLFSSVFALLPYAVIYGVMAWFSLK